MGLKIAFVMDPVESINIDKDTSFVLMLEHQKRGHEIHYLKLDDLFVRNGRARGNSTRITMKREYGNYYKLENTETIPLDSFDAVWMRKDPPFNQDFIYSTYILSLIGGNTKVINNPTGIRESNEKLYTLYFPELIPESLVTKDINELNKFLIDVGGEIVVKPLDGHGGEGVFYVKSGDRNENVVLETITKFGTEYVLAQKFIEKVSEGDKRIILLNGEPLGAVLRVPKPGGEFRCNFHSGGSPAQSALTERDLHICETLAPRIREDGLYFVGIDVIGGYVTEINTTSPTGVQEINNLDGTKIEEQVVDFIEELCSSPN